VEQVLGVELDGHLQVGDQRLELVGAGALDEVVECLVVVPLLLVEAQPALDRVGTRFAGRRAFSRWPKATSPPSSCRRCAGCRRGSRGRRS
jgi:hypothetical protein